MGKKSIELWMKLTQQSNVIFDIGANTGIYSLVAKAINSNSNVFAFEPLPAVFEILAKNNKLNNFDIQCVPLAVSNFTGNATVFLEQNTDFAYSVAVNKSLLTKGTPQKELAIKTVSINEFIDTNNIEKIDLIKIDVETHEPEVLEGFNKYIDAYLPDLLIEVSKELIIGSDGEIILHNLNSLLSNKNYLFFDIDDKNGTVTQKDKVYVSSFWNYLVCKPQTAKYLGLI
jgi:FkbM family methyltransferase